MKNYGVYRVDPKTNTRVRIGTLTERRQRDRIDNENGMLRLAQKLFAPAPIDRRYIRINPV